MPNRLAGETSPYLLQHADNPVEWYPWGEDALKLAREQDKPILLSIGYSACHWCHVMAHESFEDETTAALMNQHFVNIKVDREERPDLDKIYQVAHQLMAQRPGGWPLTVVMDPTSHAPFFAGTYFPPEPRHGMPAFTQLLLHISEWYTQHKDELGEQHTKMQDVFRQIEAGAPVEHELNRTPVANARRELEEQFDATDGGFGGAPKFPHPMTIELLFDLADRRGDKRAGEMALFTLRKMAEGGLYDQLGGGFCRYSVDARWMIPHFEKMLYDNGPLLALCSRAAQPGTNPAFAEAAEDTADWAMREMQSPEGGYYSSLDADSEGHEGKFYVWTREEVASVLEGDDYLMFGRRYGLDRGPNFEGKWHLHTYTTDVELAREFQLNEPRVREQLAAARHKLLEIRENRVRPGRDDKVLTSWNGLMIEGMATAARKLNRGTWHLSARRALDFMHTTMWRRGRLLATYKDGKAHLPAYLDDYAYLLSACLAMLQIEWHSSEITFAREIADALLNHFEDRERGGFYFTAHDHEKLLHRMKSFGDESMPSGNAVAARALLHLGWLLGEPRYLTAAERCIRAAWGAMLQHPTSHASMLIALEEFLSPPEVVILRGAAQAAADFRRKLDADGVRRRIYFIPADALNLPDAIAAKKPMGQIVAYVCRGMQCSVPITQLEELACS